MHPDQRPSPAAPAGPPESDRFWDFNPTARPYADLYPPECFCERRVPPEKQEAIRPGCGPDTKRENSLAIGMHQASTCAGWAERPTTAEFYEAIHAEEPTERQRNMLSQWVEEARWETMFHAWVEEVYTWRQLATALHRAGLQRSRWSRTLNGWAERPPETAPWRKKLTLPEPARSLWLELRDGVQESLREVGVEEYAIGGGTVLSARWNHHRRSHDIDLTVGENTRIHLLEDEDGSGFAQRMTELGGKIEFWPAGRLIQVKFGEPPNDSGLDIWGHELQLSGAEERARIDGREETVLSTAQVLWGKVARGDRALPRDVYDIVEAARRDPEALGIAVNAHSRSHGESIAMAYYMQGPKIAREGPAQLSGTASDGPAIASLGRQGAETVEAAYYRGLEILRDGNTVRITAETAGGARRTWSANYKGVDHLLSTQGLLGGVRRSGGPNMERILEYAKEGCLKGEGTELLYQEKDGRTTAWRTATAGRNLAPGKFETRPAQAGTIQGSAGRDRGEYDPGSR